VSEEELHARTAPPASHGGIEYTSNFYKMGACVPAVSMALSRGAKTTFGFTQRALKEERNREKLWRENSRRGGQIMDARKMRAYKEVEAERQLLYEQR